MPNIIDPQEHIAQLEAEYEEEAQAETGRGSPTPEKPATAIAPPKPKPIAFDEHGLMKGDDTAEELRIARWLLSTGACPDSYKTAEQVVLGIQLVKSFGLNVMAALRYTAYINNILCIWGDLPLSIVERSGKLEWKKEYFVVRGPDGKPVVQDAENLETLFEPAAAAVCIVKHRDKPKPHSTFYTVEKAMIGGLLPGHPKSAWGKNPDRMLQLRARAMALRDEFSGELLGTAIRECDVDGVEERGLLPEPSGGVAGEINTLFASAEESA